MRRQAVSLTYALLLLSGCSAKSPDIKADGNDQQCQAGLTCDGDPATGDDDDNGGDGDGDDDADDDDSGDGDGDGAGDGDSGGDGDVMSGDGDTPPPPPSVEGECKPENIVPDGCQEKMDSEADNNLCDHLDNDCDGRVDEGCSCDIGTVQRCFAGPPGRRRVGGCDDGTQRCEGTEFGYWGSCEGGKLPSDEVCDSLDNDCNGCIDEIDDCKPQLACPGPDDPRVPHGKPFSNYLLKGEDFVMNPEDVATWKWTVEGTPCDKLFLGIPETKATPENGQLSYKLNDADKQDANIDLTLSGDYLVTMTVEFKDGTDFECSWIVHVVAPGVRVELCWDTTGPTSKTNPVDVDLHVGKTGKTTHWFDQPDADFNFTKSHDCYYGNCKPTEEERRPDWGYADSPLDACIGARRGAFDPVPTTCPNPRLDIDNISEVERYAPENINVDQPKNGDTFRVMVHYYDTVEKRETHPLVNVYCGGELKGSFGVEPQVSGFNKGGGDPWDTDFLGDITEVPFGQTWRVADVKAVVDGAGETSDCVLDPLGSDGKYLIRTDDFSY